MPKKLRSKQHIVPAKPQKSVGQGTAHDIKLFPDSNLGKTGPFVAPANPPPVGDFDGWVNYWVEAVGARIELINAIQFELDQGGTFTKVRKMRDALADLADDLGMNRPGATKNPTELTWPLNGWHRIDWSQQEAQAIGFNSVVLRVCFELEPECQMVVNCRVEMDANSRKPGQGNSSSSSYLATSSSSG